MSYRSALRAAAAAALAPLVAPGRVFQAPTWPLAPSAAPAILLNTSLEAKESLGRGAVEFTVTTQLVVRLQLAAATDAAAETAIEALADLAENTLLTDETLTRRSGCCRSPTTRPRSPRPAPSPTPAPPWPPARCR